MIGFKFSCGLCGLSFPNNEMYIAKVPHRIHVLSRFEEEEEEEEAAAEEEEEVGFGLGSNVSE